MSVAGWKNPLVKLERYREIAIAIEMEKGVEMVEIELERERGSLFCH